MSQQKKKQVKKPTGSSKKLTEEASMRDRPMSKGELLLMKVGVGVIIATVLIIVGIVIFTSTGNDNSVEGPLDMFTHVTETELTYLIGYDDVSGTYGDFTFFENSENETYQDISSKLQNQDNAEVYVLFYRASTLDEALLETISALEASLLEAAFFVLDLDQTANETVFESDALSGIGVSEDKDTQLITFYIEGKELSDENIYFFDQVYTSTRDITISLENI